MPAQRHRKPTVVAIVVLIAVIALCIFAAPRHPIASARLLREISAGEPHAGAKRSGPAAVSESITYTIDGRRHAADLHTLAGRLPQAGIVLVPGVAEEGRRDPRIVALAQSLVRARFAVLVPDIANLRDLQVRPEDAGAISDAFRHLVTRPGLAPGGRAGIVAASYAVGPAVLAALDPAIRDRVRFVLGVGGYHDMREVLAFAITGCHRDRTQREPRWLHAEPGHYGKWVFLLSNLEYIPDAHDRELLRQMAERKLDDGAASVASLAAQLGEQGRSYYELLTAEEPEQVFMQLDRLAPAVQRDIAGLNLARRDLSQLHATLILIHGRNDQSIPFTESKALAAAAPKAKLYLVDNLAHVDLAKGGVRDAFQLVRAIDTLLRQR